MDNRRVKPAAYGVMSAEIAQAISANRVERRDKVIAIDLPNPRRLALSVVLGQAAVTVICALVSLWLAEGQAAMSALVGGGISSVASLAMALVGFRREVATDPERAIRAFFAGEAAKVFVVIVLFVVVLKTMKVVPLAMLGSYMATFCVFWFLLGRRT